MDQERWNAVNRIFEAALETEPSLRPAFIASQAQGDSALQAEVEVLLQADAEAGSYLERPALSVEDFQPFSAAVAPGDILCERFHLLRELGQGGMGHVFEAFDSELGVIVALKLVRSDISADPGMLARFRQEVRLARNVTHPNICRTFDFERELRVIDGKRIELFFLTMEFLQGETLSSRIKREGAISAAEALVIARQVAEALHAAHCAGIIHRDMKPANILLTPPTSSSARGAVRAVITDFGLARMDPISGAGRGHSLTGTGQPIGTLDYMAPEQLEGAPVSTATDIYAFGLILGEMITGTKAFPSGNLLGGVAERLRGALPLQNLREKDMPPRWRSAIEACVQFSSHKRPQDALEVLALLEETQPKGRRSVASRTALLRWFGRIPFAMAAIFLGVVALFATGIRLYQTRAGNKVEPGALVYLAPVKNQTGEKRFDSMAELIQAGLSQSVQINLLDPGRASDILQQMKKPEEAAADANVVREIAMRAGAVRVVLMTISALNGTYYLDVDVQQPDSVPTRFRRRWTKTFHWQPSSSEDSVRGTIPTPLLTGMREASNWIRNQAGESAHDIASLDTPPEDVTTGSWQALVDYTLGQRLVRAGKKDEAIAAYQKAIAADAGFALAYAHLADVLVAQNRRNEGYRAYISALNTDTGQRLTRKERDFIQGSYAADTRDFSTALAAFQDYSAFYPNDFNAWFYQALPLQMLNRPEEALQAALRADGLTGDTHGGATEIVYAYMVLGKHDQARKWIDIARSAGRTDPALFLQSLEAFLELDFDGSERLFTALERSASKSWRRFGFQGMTRVQAERRDYDGALSTLAQEETEIGPVGTTLDRANLALDRAYIFCRLQSFSRCVAQVSAAIGLDSSPDVLVTASDELGTFVPAMPRTDATRAIATLEHMQEILAKEHYGVNDELGRQRIAGEIYLAQGNPQRALAAFRKADDLDAPFRARDYLARCLLAVAAHTSDRAIAEQMKEEALVAYGRTALQLASVWRKPKDYPPGFGADTMTDYVQLAHLLKGHSSTVNTVETLLTMLRPQSLQTSTLH